MQAMLDSCDRSSLTGSRDFAILTVLARLGLRAGELAGLCLEDIDWRAGEIIIRRGKARREDRLPLLTDVGEALAVYLANSRPVTTCRSVFVTRHAPIRSLHPNTVSRAVLVACRRAGVPGGALAQAPPRLGGRTGPPGSGACRHWPGAASPGLGHHRRIHQLSGIASDAGKAQVGWSSP